MSKARQAFAKLTDPEIVSCWWETALTRLVVHALCPWCNGDISNVTITRYDVCDRSAGVTAIVLLPGQTASGVEQRELSWSCPEGCNP